MAQLYLRGHHAVPLLGHGYHLLTGGGEGRGTVGGLAGGRKACGGDGVELAVHRMNTQHYRQHIYMRIL